MSAYAGDLAHGYLRGERAGVEYDPDATLRRSVARAEGAVIFPEQLDAPLIGQNEAQSCFDGRGLTGSVASYEPGHAALFDGEADAVERESRVAFYQIAYMQKIAHGASFLAFVCEQVEHFVQLVLV